MVVISGSAILLLLIGAALVAIRRSPDAGPSPASIEDSPDALTATDASGGVAFEATEFDLGTVPAGEPRLVVAPWRRTGPGALRVSRVATGCGCLGASGLPEVLPPGARGQVVLRVAGRETPGPFHLGVEIHTDRPPNDRYRLLVRGYVGTAVVVAPLSLPLAALSPGEVVERVVTVRAPPGPSPPRIEARLSGIEGEVRIVDPIVARDREASGTLGRDVIVSLRAPTVAGPFAATLEIRSAGEGLWRIPVRGTVVAPRAPTPER